MSWPKWALGRVIDKLLPEVIILRVSRIGTEKHDNGDVIFNSQENISQKGKNVSRLV
jgi:hypothetical protein